MNETPTTAPPASILIVDDNHENLRLLAGVLTQQKYGVRAAPSGQMALAAIQAELPDLILLDIRMPDMDGYEVCTQLKADERTRDIPVIFISIAAQVFDKVKAFAVGGVDYVTKPFQIEELLARVETHLTLRNLQKSLGEKNVQLEQEIAERVRVEEALRESEELYRITLENILDPVFITTEDGQFTLICPNVPHILGYTIEEMEAVGNISHLVGRDLFNLEELEDKKEIRNTERVIAHKNGRERIYLITVKRLSIKGGTILYTCHDVTELKRAEDELKKHRDHLEELVKARTVELAVAKEQALEARRIAESNAQAAEAANQAKSAFLASMSHELRTPLNAILGYAQILQRRPLEADVIDALKTIQQSGEHLLTLINDILTISKIETGRLELHPAQIHLPNFLEHIVGIIRGRAEAKGLTFTFDTSPISPEGGLKGGLPTWVRADETRLRQVLLNLLDNAVKFTETGQVTLRVAGRQQQSEQGSQGAEEQGGDFSPAPRPPGPPAHPSRLPSIIYRLRFEVEDTGPGISPNHLKRIFQPFEQAEDVTRWTQGAGLGLPISRQLVELMGGELHVESPPSVLPSVAACGDRRKEVKGGPGSLFWFEVALPVTEVVVEAVPPPERVITGYRGTRRTVLVADDVPSNRAVLVDLLEPLGFDVVEAADGRQAIHLAQELRPDLILMDRWMPVLDGFEAARQIRQNPELAGVTIVAISASVSKEDQEQSREAGIDAFLPKPVHWPELAALLEEHLGLEWEYQKPESTGAGEPGREFPSAPPPPLTPAPLVPPPEEELAILYELALRGDMRGIREQAAHVETLGEQYAPFARKLRELARGFEEREILALIKEYVEEEQ